MNSYYQDGIFMRIEPGGEIVRVDVKENDEKKKLARRIPKAKPIPVDLPKLEQAIMVSNHHTKKELVGAQVGEKEKVLQKLWNDGWRPSKRAIAVWDSNINPYIR